MKIKIQTLNIILTDAQNQGAIEIDTYRDDYTFCVEFKTQNDDKIVYKWLEQNGPMKLFRAITKNEQIL